MISHAPCARLWPRSVASLSPGTRAARRGDAAPYMHHRDLPADACASRGRSKRPSFVLYGHAESRFAVSSSVTPRGQSHRQHGAEWFLLFNVPSHRRLPMDLCKTRRARASARTRLSGGKPSEIIRPEACALRDARQHAAVEFFAVVKREDEVRLARARERLL